LVARGDSTEENKAHLASSRQLNCNDADEDITEKSARSAMDLETEALFGRHVKALLRKRAYNFQRDKKAWCCTTILPVLFVTMGFMLSHFAAPERNLNPITLDLSGLNPGSTAVPQFNPIPVNSPDNPYACQPGVCSYDALVVVDDTDETYSFCGSQGYLAGYEEVSNASIPLCSIANSARIMRTIDGLHGASVVEANVSSVLEVRHPRQMLKRWSHFRRLTTWFFTVAVVKKPLRDRVDLQVVAIWSNLVYA
jgi:hypothetical protein